MLPFYTHDFQMFSGFIKWEHSPEISSHVNEYFPQNHLLKFLKFSVTQIRNVAIQRNHRTCVSFS